MSLPPALQVWRDKVMDYKDKHGGTLKEAMIALKPKQKKGKKGGKKK